MRWHTPLRPHSAQRPHLHPQPAPTPPPTPPPTTSAHTSAHNLGASLPALSQLPPHVGFPVYNGTDLWTGSWANAMERKAGGVEPPRAVYFEYGRKVVIPASANPSKGKVVTPASANPSKGKHAGKPTPPTMRPVWTLDFAILGRGVTYTNKGTAKGGNGSVMWHTYTMPVGGRVHGSWYHTHAYAASEMWVIAGDVEVSLPEAMVKRAKSKSGDKGGYLVQSGSRGTYKSAQASGCFTCLLHMSASHVCFTCLLHMSASHVCSTCLLHMSASHVRFTCLLHMSASHVCFTCLLHMSCFTCLLHMSAPHVLHMHVPLIHAHGP